jgi:flagellar biosynthesis/type III secretory pathway M-ring protein FliF/YscJ
MKLSKNKKIGLGVAAVALAAFAVSKMKKTMSPAELEAQYPAIRRIIAGWVKYNNENGIPWMQSLQSHIAYAATTAITTDPKRNDYVNAINSDPALITEHARILGLV